MKKMLMCAAAGAVVMSCASANDIDVNQIRTACQSSDKTLWVERNQVCIPRNPCKNDKFKSYCNRMFADVQTRDLGYMVLIDLYAQAHNLSCKPVRQDAKLVGQDYVVCNGTDVMVFEFDDIHDFVLLDISYENEMRKELCKAVDGVIYEGESGSGYCHQITEEKCKLAQNVLQSYGFGGDAGGWNGTDCFIYLRDYFQAEKETFWKTGRKFF